MSASAQPLTVESQAAVVIEGMNLIGYDAMVLGAQDLQLGVDVLQQRINEADFAVLSANVRLAETGELFTSPYTILQVDGLSVGLVGLTDDAPDLPPAFTISDPIEAASQSLSEIGPQTDLIVLLSHVGWDKNKELAELSGRINLVISGGSQQTDAQPYRSPSTGTWLAQAELSARGHAGRIVGRWDLELGTGSQITAADWKVVSLGPQFADDVAMAALLRRYRSQ